MNLGLVKAKDLPGVYASTWIIDMAPGFLSTVNFIETSRAHCITACSSDRGLVFAILIVWEVETWSLQLLTSTRWFSVDDRSSSWPQTSAQQIHFSLNARYSF
ncbi:MAG: hypothetical protein QOH41_4303 [Blastocatellia bacterium]|jgi:hypothetical protein|nr:hypothetical protein [Blastocatellia bacterium]